MYLPENNYVYNHDNPLCNSAVKPNVVEHCSQLIRAKQCYGPLIRWPKPELAE
jgi:hypothetical protein